ncbi:MerR family transcriptional regulator [Clostridium tagluense]|uniref:MerR family transcriptional regulator n=1 Tax=Clostridium tagluense TaxID=360422 RepID=UPI001CF29CE8|nr:MerR family transcriptional regulator [Clostridium tagluense]MCB2311324.1 MerR family transcriptional regulator [Clostridium tagluense]MCB2316034.1 MerR family transcriptional regulator [Clostridium tagluense]MCB2320900.1 MerR family transcriptional regulator [Clostridium tagluense]MCB2325903.1 MerR family transcriptional regulator [Clostridium tagluense]MCB2330640.1 MerR family transcriptional regulator [Clostridium tagluense]
MNIKAAAEKTGLTKRAIKYYESEGLITPLKNIENNYREYTCQDVIKLNLIGALRAVDISIAQIKTVTSGNKSIPEVMRRALSRIDKDIDDLEKSRLIILNIIEKNLTDYDTAGEHIKLLRETLELSIGEKKEYISNALRRIFPGIYGESLIMNFEPFLNIVIDNEEKRRVWLKLVEVLDEINESEEFFLDNIYLNKFINEVISEEDKRRHLSGIEKIINYDKLYIKEYIKRIVDGYLLLKEDEKEKEEINEFGSFSKDYSKVFGHLHKKFSEYLIILNEDYKKYMENMTKITVDLNKKMEEETGMNVNEFFERYIIER